MEKLNYFEERINLYEYCRGEVGGYYIILDLVFRGYNLFFLVEKLYLLFRYGGDIC